MTQQNEGIVLAVGSHRAWERLRRALGRGPAEYYDRQMRRSEHFVVLYGDEVSTALGIASIRRTRLKPGDVARCMGVTKEQMEEDRRAGQ